MQSLWHIAVITLFRRPWMLVMMLLAVAAGTGFQIPNGANLEGYNTELLEKAVARISGHIALLPVADDRIYKVADARQRVQSLPFVRQTTVRLQHGGVLLTNAGTKPVGVVGLEPQAEDAAFGFCEMVTSGGCLDNPARTELLLGATLAKQLSAKVGDRLPLAWLSAWGCVRILMPIPSLLTTDS